ncbi:protein DGS1, mitochondrial [Quercus lobata]|uniref:protein DGS1, mitochondrial n=1 Tax=Quercus lobata TaxID=97700 RepID=UPI001246E9C5|nr:protein DGS1, mitochondrial [Quercus lobata]
MEVATVENNNESKDHSNNNNNNNRTLFSFYSNYIWNRVLAFLPSSSSSSSSSSSASNVFAKISNLYRQSARVGSRTHGACLPLPLPSNSFDSASLVMSDTSRVYEVLEDILEHIILNLRIVQKNLQFWQSRAEGSNARKMYFMIFERGPLAFIDGAVQLIRGCADEGSSMQHLCHSASSHISERVAVLSSLRCALATFLAQIYMEVDRFGEKLVKDPENSLPLLLVTINDIFSNLEASIGHLHAMCQSVYSVEGSYSLPLLFEKLPGVNQEGSQWTDCEVRDAIDLIYQNLLKLDSYLSDIVAKHRKPRKITLHWIRYTCGAVGLSVCSMWVLRHSSLMGNSDIDKWIGDARDSTVSFFNDHVEQPLLSIRDELFETFRKRHKGVMEPEEVLLTSNSLHRMLLAFSEQTKGQKIPENASDQELLEIVMSRYEKELMHPVQNLLSGELARALLIQVQKLKLDIETAMLELDQILKANEINFAILAALPAFFLSLILLMLVRTWFKRDTRAEGRGRMARVQRRLLIVEVEKRIVQYQTYVDQGQEKDAQCMFGLVLYSLDRLYHAVEKHAKATGEWQCLRQDIIDLGKPDLKTTYKLLVTSRLERLYDCLLPSPTRR